MDLSPTRPPPQEEEAYVDMNCQGQTRTSTIESGISEICLLSPDEDIIHIDDSIEVTESSDNDISDILRVGGPLVASNSCSSLPNEPFHDICDRPSDSVSISECKRPCDSDQSDQTLPFSSMRPSASSGCLESKSQESLINPVSISIPRILRNSFSKLLTRATSISSGRSKSPESNKSSLDDENLSVSSKDDKKGPWNDEGTDEIVRESVENGLPIIPFAYPTFTCVDKKLEETRNMIRKNSAKDLKLAFDQNRKKNFDIYNETEEEEVKNEDKSLYSIVHTAKAELMRSYSTQEPSSTSYSSSPSSYVEMSLSADATSSKSFQSPVQIYMSGSLESDKKFANKSPVQIYMAGSSVEEDSYMIMDRDPVRRLSEEPYMRMSEESCARMKEEAQKRMSQDSYMQMNTFPRKLIRRVSDEPMFQLEDSVSFPSLPCPGQSPPERVSSSSNSNYSGSTFPRRKKKINIFNRTQEDGERNNQILHGSMMKPFRKGNKHKDDYVYVDFEKQNYMDMASTGSNKWKFLNFTSSHK